MKEEKRLKSKHPVSLSYGKADGAWKREENLIPFLPYAPPPYELYLPPALPPLAEEERDHVNALAAQFFGTTAGGRPLCILRRDEFCYYAAVGQNRCDRRTAEEFASRLGWPAWVCEREGITHIDFRPPSLRRLLIGDVLHNLPHFREAGDPCRRAPYTDLHVALGAAGERVRFLDFAQTPFLLAGAEDVRQVREICDAVLLGLMNEFSPYDVRFLLLSTTGGFRSYAGIPHLLLPPAYAREGELRALRWAISEVERRYELFHLERAESPVWNIDRYNERHKTDGKALYRVFIVLDDLPCCSQEGIRSLRRITQKGRAAGICVLLGLSSVGIMGLPEELLANFMGKLMLPAGAPQAKKLFAEERVPEESDEALLSIIGEGVERITVPQVPAAQRDAAVKFLRSRMHPHYIEIDETTRSSDDEVPEKWLRALRFVVETGEVHIEAIHDVCEVGYAESGRILDWMEWNGFIGPFQKMHRDVYLTKERLIELFGEE